MANIRLYSTVGHSRIIEKLQTPGNYFKNGNKWGVKLSYLEEKNQLGTAGALSLLKKSPKEPIVVVNGDVVTNLNIL